MRRPFCKSESIHRDKSHKRELANQERAGASEKKPSFSSGGVYERDKENSDTVGKTDGKTLKP